MRLKRLLTLVVGVLVLGSMVMLGEGAFLHARAGLGQALLERTQQRERTPAEAAKPWAWLRKDPIG